MGHDRLIACPRNEEAALSGTERRVVNINLPRTRNLGTGWDECSNSKLGHLAVMWQKPRQDTYWTRGRELPEITACADQITFIQMGCDRVGSAASMTESVE
jgi:hypothetical protein